MNSRLQYRGSNWFTTGEAQLMAEMAGVGVFDLSKIVDRPFPLDGINDALACVRERPAASSTWWSIPTDELLPALPR